MTIAIVGAITGVRSCVAASSSAEAADRSTDLAQKALQQAEEHFRFDHRPVVSAIAFNVIISQDGLHFEPHFAINIEGPTPITYLGRELVAYYDHRPIAQGPQASGFGVPLSHSSFGDKISIDLTGDQAANIQNGKALLQVVFTLHYKDVFGEKVDVAWCHRYEPTEPNMWSLCDPAKVAAH